MISFVSSLISFPNLPSTRPWSFSNTWCTFSLIVVTCTSKYLSITSSVSFKLLVYMFSDWLFAVGYLIAGLLPLGSFSVCMPSIFLISFCMVEASWLCYHQNQHIHCWCPSLKLNVQSMNWSQSLSPRIISVSITLQYSNHDSHDFH